MSYNYKDKHTLRSQQENEILRRVLLWLGAAILLEAFVLVVNRYYFHFMSNEIGRLEGIASVLQTIQFAGLILGVVLFIWAIYAKKNTPQNGMLYMVLGLLFFGIAGASLLFLRIGSASVSPLLVMIPVIAGLVMVYYLYQKEFFTIAVISAVGILGLWIYRKGSVRYASFFYVYAIVTIVLMVAIAILFFQLMKQDGTLNWKGNPIQVVEGDANYSMVWISCALVALAFVLAPVLGVNFAYYAFLALIVWVFIMAVYFTSRLM